ncbi:MAG: hypothetical protein HGA44_23550 [Cellulomonadaceae bacterium]|nr:hypothetical protein [Cellulomonadaceae bacterium]
MLVLAAAVPAVAGLAACAEPSPCQSAFEAAAAVPPGDVNDAEMLDTLRVCGAREWSQALDSHPEVLGLTAVTTQDLLAVVKLLCPQLTPGESEYCDDWNEAFPDS